MGLCFEIDNFIDEKVVWQATLTDGSVVYQDDHRPGEEEPCAWLRLAHYMKEKQKESEAFGIERLHIKFWDHIEEAAPAGALGYYWINGLEAIAGQTREYYKYVIGSVQDGENHMNVVHWLVPEILPLEHEVRSIPYDDPLLISKRTKSFGEKQN